MAFRRGNGVGYLQFACGCATGTGPMREKNLSSSFGPRFASSLADKMAQGSIVINGGQISRGYHGEATAIGDVTISNARAS